MKSKRTANAKYFPLLFALIGLLLNTFAIADVVDFQVITPPTWPDSNIQSIFFGSGVAITPDKKNVLSIGFDSYSSRQFAIVYPANTFGVYAETIEVFMGDVVNANNVLNANTSLANLIVPLCISSDANWIAFGSRPGGVNQTGSVIIANKNATGNFYNTYQRLNSPDVFTSTFFPIDMVCTRDMKTIYVSEVSTPSQIPPFVRTSIFSWFNDVWIANRTETYWNGTELDFAPLAITSNGDAYAAKGSFPGLVYIHRAVDGSLFAVANVSEAGLTPIQIAITNSGKRLAVGQYTFNSGDGALVIFDFDENTGTFNTSAGVFLTSDLIASGSQLGYSISFSGNGTYSGIVSGMPGALSTQGAGLGWKPFLDTGNNSIDWPSAAQLMQPFGPGLSNNIFLGRMGHSHNLISDDEVVALFGAPGANGNEGYVYVFKFPMPVIQPVTPPTSTPPTSTPPTGAPTTQSNAAFIVAMVFVGLFGLALIILIWRVIRYTCCSDPPSSNYRRNVHN